ncbi:unnamed protein product [marine sediment metagenome]|uniref:Uncharacterized protein n=1 Tax=marine sediment metagenome TaxID=412755 RepID=X1EJX8_9ZZZZ
MDHSKNPLGWKDTGVESNDASITETRLRELNGQANDPNMAARQFGNLDDVALRQMSRQSLQMYRDDIMRQIRELRRANDERLVRLTKTRT